MDDCTDLSLKMLGRSIKSIPLLIKGILRKISDIYRKRYSCPVGEKICNFFSFSVKASFFSTLRFCLRVNGYNFMGSNSAIFILPISSTVAFSKGKNLHI